MAYTPNNPNGQATMANSTPVVIASNQSNIPITGNITVNNPTETGLAKDTTLTSNLGLQADTAAISDTGTFSLIALFKRLLSKVPSLGQANAANSQPVALSIETATGNITTQNLVPAGTATAGSAVEISLNGNSQLAIQVTGTYTGALSVQLTANGTTWVTVTATSLINAATGAYSATIASATQGIFQVECAGFTMARVTALAAVTGTATVTLRAVNSTGFVSLDNALPAGTNAIGTVTANLAANSTITPAGSTAQGASTYFTLVSAATNNLTQVKAGATTVNTIHVSNSSALTGRYLKIFNALSASVVMGTTNANLNFYIPPNSSIVIDTGAFGIRFATGYTIAITTGIALNDNTAAVANEVTVTTTYF